MSIYERATSRNNGFRIYACFFMGNNKDPKILAGENSCRHVHPGIPISTHAEMSALHKLKNYVSSRGRRLPLKVDMMVIRISKTGIINNARPCKHCIMQLYKSHYINLKNVYYSDEFGNIKHEKFVDLIQKREQFISSGYRHLNCECNRPK